MKNIIEKLEVKKEDINIFLLLIKEKQNLINNFLELSYELSDYFFSLSPLNYPQNIHIYFTSWNEWNKNNGNIKSNSKEIKGNTILKIIFYKILNNGEDYSKVYLELFDNLDFYTESEEILSKKIDQKYLDMCSQNFQEHKEIIEKIKQDGYEIEKIFFRDILSGDYPEIEGYDSETIEKSLSSLREELVPVLVFNNGKNRFCLELHYSGSPF